MDLKEVFSPFCGAYLQLLEGLESAGLACDKEAVKTRVCNVDEDGNYTLSFREFLNFMVIHEGIVTKRVPEYVFPHSALTLEGDVF